MQHDTYGSTSTRGDSYVSILREIGASTKDLVQDEMDLITSEIKETSRSASRHVTQAAIFGGLLTLSVLPFIAFLVIGLGNWLGGRYAMSSFIVAAVFAIVGGAMTWRAYKKLKEDVTLEATKRTLRRETRAVGERTEDVKDAVKGETHANHLH